MNKMSQNLTSTEIRSRFLQFFKKRGHTIIPSASLITSDEKGITNPTLFNTAGMQPLIPYLLGKPYFGVGEEKNSSPITRLVDSQKCLRTVDFDSIGDKTHATFFEMLGNWSLGDYFKKEAINWSYEFLTSKSEVEGDRGLGLDPSRLYVTVFQGDENAPRDNEAAQIWKDIFKSNGVDGAEGDTTRGEAGRIFYMPAENNWWQAGESGPCGPDSEMFYDIPNKFGGRPITKEEYLEADDKRDVIEVWNDVFMQYEKKDGKIIGNLPRPSIDTGAGLERLTITLQGVDNIYETDLFEGIMKVAGTLSNTLKSQRIISDHIRSSVFLMADGVIPSNTDRGYILRRLIRRAVYNTDAKKLDKDSIGRLVDAVAKTYLGIYGEIEKNIEKIKLGLIQESEKFNEAIVNGSKELEKLSQKNISGADAFRLFSSYGFPIDMTIEIAKKNGVSVDVDGYNSEFKKHQELSRSGAEQKFKGGLADANDPMIVRYHTATHLLHRALFDVLGDGVMQKGSNITTERLRFDFVHGAKMTDEEKKRVEEIVNNKIAEKLPVNKVIMSKSEAEKTGAKHFFGEKYGDEISVYFVGNDLTSAFSKEFCGGPHVSNTSELAGPEGKWRFRIAKEEAVAQGIRRIKAVLGE